MLLRMPQNPVDFSPYLHFSRAEWCEYRQDAPLTLTEENLEKLHGQLETISMNEVVEIYLPLSRLLNFYVTATQSLHQATQTFLGHRQAKVPFILGVSGSVAVGKSLTSRVLQALLSRWPNHPHVAIVTTDGFLFPNTVLEKKQLMARKGFPESYDTEALVTFLQRLKSGETPLSVPMYSHRDYDIIPNQREEIHQPDIVIMEGLNILQPNVLVSDYIDFTIYVDAETAQIKEWFLKRFQLFCERAVKDKQSFFHQFTPLTPEEAYKFAERVWHETNEVNLLQNIFPYKNRADLILYKSADHSVQTVSLRKL